MFHLSSEAEDDSSSSSSSSSLGRDQEKEKREKRTPTRAGIVNEEEAVERAREEEVRAYVLFLSLSREKF